MTENQPKDNEKNEKPLKSIINSAKDVKLCPICLATITSAALTDTCSHEFCFDCISQWSANHNRCPICRQLYSNIKYNIVSNETFDVLPVEEQPEVDDEEIETILHRMLLYLRLIGLRNRTQRRREELRTEMTTIEETVKKCGRKRNEKKRLQKKIDEMRPQIRQLDEEIQRFNHTLSAESPSEEELLEALDGREDEIQDIEVIDIIFDPDELVVPDDQEAEEESIGSIPSLVSVDDSGNESDDEQESEEQVVTRKRKPSPQTRNTDSDDSDHSSPKRKRNKRQ